MDRFILGLLTGILITYIYYYIKTRIIRCWECDRLFWYKNIEYDFEGVPYCSECRDKLEKEIWGK